MLDLWAAGEKDMLSDGNQYSLKNTGQGLQRIQASYTAAAAAAADVANAAADGATAWLGLLRVA